MSSKGIRRPRDSDSRIATSILNEEQSQIQSEKIFTETNIIVGNNGVGIANQGTAAGNYLSKSGDIRGGPMGNEFSITTISSDTIEVDISSENYFPVVLLNGESGADDSLSSITPGVNVFHNQEIIIQAAVDNITIEENLLNNNPILTPGSSDVILAPGEMAKVIYSALVSSWVLVWNSPSSGGGVSFPITPPVDSRGNVNTTQDIDLSLTTAHSTKMTLTGDIAITFSNIPTTDTQIEWEIEILQDGTGGHSITSWPAGVNPIPVIDDDANARTLIALRTNDNGTIIDTLFASAGVVSNVSLWSTFTAVSNINVGNSDILAVKNLDFDDVASKITGLKTLEFFDDAPNKTIASTASAIEHDVPTLESHIFNVGVIEVGRFTESSSTVFELELQGNRISGLGDMYFDLAGGDIVINRFSMEYDVGGFARINVPNLEEFRFQDGGTTNISFVPFASIGYELQGIAAINLLDTTINPAIAGEIYLNGADVKIYSGGAVRNISDIGSGSQTPWTSDIDADGWDLFDVGIISQQGSAIPTSGFINMANSAKISWEASPAGTDGTLTYNLGEHFEFSGDRAIVSVSGAPIGQSGQRWGTVWATDVDASGLLFVRGNTTLGDSAVDTLTVTATSTFNADVGLGDNDILDVNNLYITTALGAAVASIRGIDSSPDILEIRLGAASDFVLSDNGTSFYQYINTTGIHVFSGNEVELNVDFLEYGKELTTNPSTPAANKAREFLFDDGAGNQFLKIRFANGNVKTIADDT